MIEQQLANINFVGKDGFIWWIGQIPTEGTWSANIPGRRTTNNSQHKGFGYRYKVRIMGYHTHDKTILSDDDLPWASLMFPVTAGSGAGGASQSPNLRQGDFVYGFFLDGENAQVPIIMGVIGHNQYTGISKNADSKIGYTPFGGFTPTDFVPAYSTPAQKPPDPAPAARQERAPGNPNQPPSPITNNSVDLDHGIKDKASEKQKSDGSEVQPIKKNSDCEPIPLSEIQIRIQNLIKKIEKIKKDAESWEGAVLGKINNIQSDINKAIDDAAKWITGGVKWIITETQKYITNTINNAFKDTYYNIFPNQRPGLKKAVETANDVIACMFRKIIGSLLGIVRDFLLQIVDRFINTPLCAVESFITSLLGQLSGLILATVNSILGPISSIVGGVFDIANSVFNIITNLLSFISCDEQPSCSPLTTWSTWGGTISSVSSDVQNLVNQVQSIASTVTQAVDPNNFNFELDFSNILADTCNVGPLFCGPPEVQFIGGGGTGASANAVINSIGQILSVDVLSEGSGYQSPPVVSFVDACGKGSGASATAVLGEVTTTNPDGTTTTTTGVVDVIMTSPGTGYLPQQDGSLGGDGRTWANAEDSYILRSDGTYDLPYQPGDILNIRNGDTVYLPGSEPYVSTVDESISAPSVSRNIRINELGQIDPQTGENVTTNENVQDDNTLSDGKYPVILELDGIIIDNTGFNYSPNDKIVISPDNGASAIPTFNDFGALIKVDLLTKGYGFKEFPDIYIESDTGYNARLIPTLNVIRVGQNNTPDQVMPGDKIISVVDCVGKF